jgi:hypothetical protein
VSVKYQQKGWVMGQGRRGCWFGGNLSGQFERKFEQFAQRLHVEIDRTFYRQPREHFRSPRV